MRRIIFLMVLLLPVVVIAQVKPDYIRSPNGPNTIVDWNVKFKTMIIPHGPTLSLAGSQDSTGHVRMVINGSDTSLNVYVRGFGWLKLANKRDIITPNLSIFKLKTDSTANSGYVTHGYFNSIMPSKADTGSFVHRTGNKTETVTGKKNFTGIVGFSGTTSIDAAGLVTNGIRRFNNSIPFTILAPSNPVLTTSLVIQPAYPGSDTSLRRISTGKNKALMLIRDSLIINDTYVADHAAVKVQGAIIQSGSSTGKTAAFWGKFGTIIATDYATFRDSTSAAQGYALKFEGDAPSLTNGSFYGVTESTTDSTRKLASTALLHQVISQLSPGRITYTSGTGASNSFTSTALVNCFVEGIWRDGVEYALTGSSSPTGNKAYVNTTTGAVTFQDNITSSEYIVIRYRGIQGVSTLGGSLRFISTSSYSDMAAQLSGNTVKVFYVQSDEVNGGGYPTEYIYYNGQLIRNIPQLAN